MTKEHAVKKIAGRTLASLGVMGLVALGAGSVSADTYTGTLTSAGGGITGTSAWVDNLTLRWTVDDTTNPGFWTYTYEFEDNDTAQQKDLSHLIIEVSASFTASDIHADTPDVSVDSPKTFTATSDGNSNPNLPGPIYGVKWNVPDEDDGTDWTATLVTARAPVWGDFYVKDGKTDGIDNSAWNTGFLDPDPLDLPDSGSINNHVLVPDTYTTPVPEPGTLLLVGTGLASAGAWSRKRWFGRKSA